MKFSAIKFRNHYCFKSTYSGFDGFKPINVIIGRNNTGKSRLLDLVHALCFGATKRYGWELECHVEFEQADLQGVFSPHSNGGGLPGNHWNDNGKYFVGAKTAVEFAKDGHVKHLTISEQILGGGTNPSYPGVLKARREGLTRVIDNSVLPLNGKHYRLLSSERDITIEMERKELNLTAQGDGATNVIRRFLLTSDKNFPSELVQNELRSALNEIFGPEGTFTTIEVKQHDDEAQMANVGGAVGSWEIYLREENKGGIALSKSGSGLKTVILVLLNLLVIPKIQKIEVSEHVFAFEELENNLHPSLLRRLFRFIEEFIIKHGALVFITTHSSVALDVFGLSANAQLIHVTHDGASSRAGTVATHFGRQGIITELGAKPSDLLQANGIVWVEGPSDRVYLNRWIEIMSGGKLREGLDYVCAFYGGALLARTQFVSPEDAQKELTNLLCINSNIAVICDSDRTAATGDGSELKARVRRIKAEVEKIQGSFIWITSAKEIENYLPSEALAKAFELAPLPAAPGQFERFFPPTGDSDTSASFLQTHLNRKGIDKVELAEMTTPHMSFDSLKERFDWKDECSALISKIFEWNT